MRTQQYFMHIKLKKKLKNSKITTFVLAAILSIICGCAAIKEGESWKMVPENHTIGLTLLWELPEKRIREILPADQIPRIQNGNAVFMLFLASTDAYEVGGNKYGHLGVAHLIIPLQNSIAIPETIGLKTQPIISRLKRLGFLVKFGDVRLTLEEIGDIVKVNGFIDFGKGNLTFSGITTNKKGDEVYLPNTTLVGKNPSKNILSGPEFYRPIRFESIQVENVGDNWMKKFDLTQTPNRIWLNVDFGIDFQYLKNKSLIK